MPSFSTDPASYQVLKFTYRKHIQNQLKQTIAKLLSLLSPPPIVIEIIRRIIQTLGRFLQAEVFALFIFSPLQNDSNIFKNRKIHTYND